MQESANCPLCSAAVAFYASIDKVGFHECKVCNFIFADPEFLQRVDAGESLRNYDAEYWSAEISAARQRSFGSSLARVAEAVLYCRIPIRRFLDIGTGPGFLLDALAMYLPSHSELFYGVEKFPPDPSDRSVHPNYLAAGLEDLEGAYECGVCIEVFEHLTPLMADRLAYALRSVSVPGSLFLFNTGLTDYVRHEDPGYLDPRGRGHICSWSVTAARKIFAAHGFLVHALPGKTWAFIVELPYPQYDDTGQIADRIWSAPECNRQMLTDPHLGSVIYILGIESARAYS